MSPAAWRYGRSAATGRHHDWRGFLGIDVDPKRIQKRVESGYCDRMATTVDEALQLLADAKREAAARSVGLVGNAADVLPELLRRNVIPEIVTDQTSAHDPLNGYVPNGMSFEAALELRQRDSEQYVSRSMAAMGKHLKAMLEVKRHGPVVFDYGNNLRTNAKLAGVEDASRFPGFVPNVARCFAKARGRSVGWRSPGDPEDIRKTDRLVLSLFPGDEGAATLDQAGAASASSFRGCLRASAGWATGNGPSWGWR